MKNSRIDVRVAWDTVSSGNGRVRASNSRATGHQVIPDASMCTALSLHTFSQHPEQGFGTSHGGGKEIDLIPCRWSDGCEKQQGRR